MRKFVQIFLSLAVLTMLFGCTSSIEEQPDTATVNEEEE